MADNLPPQKPKSTYSYNSHSEPLAMSFLSPGVLSSLQTEVPKPPSHSHVKPANATAQIAAPKEHHGNNTGVQAAQPTPETSTTTNADTSAPEPAAPKILKPLAPQEIDVTTFTGFKFLTLDALQIETRDVYDRISGTFQWEMCETQHDRCLKIITEQCKNKRAFLISSGSLAKELVPKIHELPQLYAVYIYCANVKYHSEWSKQYSKVRVVCDNDDLYLLPQFAVDVAQANIDWANAYLKAGLIDKAREKFKLAANKLNDHARNHDEEMDVEITKKLDQCK